MRRAGLAAAPRTWEQFLASFGKLRDAGITPVAMPAKVWAHAEWFENLLLRTAGVEAATQLARHKMAWTDPLVKATLRKWAAMLKAGCCDPAADMLALDSGDASLKVLKQGSHAYMLIGMWVNDFAKNEYLLKEGADYAQLQFPALGQGHDDTASIDTKEQVSLTSGANPQAADAFMGWMVGPKAASILASAGVASSSSRAQTALYGPLVAGAVKAVSSSKIQFVLGDLLPGELVVEYRLQLRNFLQDPSDANIDRVLAAIEAKAAKSYP
jgi:multiple sugar transport system substrate-binding protein